MNGVPLWTADQVAGAVGAHATGDWTATGVSIDSRTIEPGDLFVALRGPNFDGHDYVSNAFERGAAAALVERRPDGLADDAPLIEVADTMAALGALGRAGAARAAARIVAITGSVGKTGTKEALALALSAQGATAANYGNLNNHIGVPLSLARMPSGSMFGVFELGMNQPGEIGRLSRLVRPQVAIVTTIAAVHAAAFDSVHAIAEEKGAIFEGMTTGGVAILNRDNAYFPVLAELAGRHGVDRIVGFGAHPEASARLIDCAVGPTSTQVSALIDGLALTYRIGLSGRHHALNSLAVLVAVRAVGADIGSAAVTLGDLGPASGRGRQHRVPLDGGAVTLIDDSYNASPASMRAAFTTLGAVPPGPRGRRIAVLGDMLELGDDASRLHRGLAADLDANGVDLLFSCGPEMAHLDAAVPAAMRGRHAADSEALVGFLIDALRDGDVVLVKGSHGSRMDVVVDALMTLGTRPAVAANGG